MQKIRNPLRGVLDNLRGTPSAPTRPEWPEFEDNLRSEHFQSAKTIRHGFPHQPTAMAFDPVQNLLAIGTRNGSIRIFGTPGVDCHMKHEEAIAVTQLIFLVNEGALISICSDDTLYLWTLRQKKPEIIHSLKFQRERITVCHLPFRSEYLYIGTERGNVYVAQTLQFQLSGYLIHWNKAIELSQRNHPGSVIHLSDNPLDQNQLLIGFESGVIVLWDLKLKAAEFRFSSSEPLRSISWNSEGKQFMSSHTDGSLAIWNVKASKPASSVCPHAKISTEGKPEPCRPIRKVEWKTVRNGEPFQIFNGGMAYEKGVNTPSLTVIHGKSTTVLEMEHKVIDFITLCPTPWTTDFQEPYGIVVLLQNDLVVIDLNSPGYPCFENPYAMDIHESAVTACQYYANCSPDLIPAFYCVGSKQKRTCFSEKKWPIHGGEWGTTPCSYSEIIITGHADGSLKFWDASAVTLQQLYKLKTAKVFDRSKCRSPDSEDDPFAIQHINLCEETRLLLVAGHTHLMLFKYSKSDSSIDVTTLDISITYEIYDELDSPDLDYPSTPLKPSLAHQQSGSLGSYSSSASANDGKVYMGEPQSSVKVKTGARKWTHGYQPDLCCVVSWIDGEPPPVITSVALNTKLNLFAFGNECGLGIVDIAQKTCLLNMGTPDLYGSMDPYSRAPRSPRSKMHPRQGTDSMSLPYSADDNKSTSNDQINGVCLSPTNPKHKRPHPPDLKRTKSQGTRKLQKGYSSSSQSIEDSDFSGDKSDGSFSRSRSSSMSSLENISKEAIQHLVFVEAYINKTDAFCSPSLWVGTTLGSVLVISLNIPADEELRKSQPVMVSPSGTIFRLKGLILTINFMECSFAFNATIQQSDSYKERAREDWIKDRKNYSRQQSVSNMKARMSPTSSTENANDRQLAIICSERHARVIALPSQTCASKVKITDTSVVVKAEVIPMKDSLCLGCYIANGHILMFGLPSLKPLLDVDHMPVTDVRVAKTFSFSQNGHALYFCSPSEVQKITLSADICENLNEMLGELFLPCETPEAPKISFFNNLFGGGQKQLDREELFGESSGKVSIGVAKYTAGNAGMTAAQTEASGAMGDVARAKQALIERGAALSNVEDVTAKMMESAHTYGKSSHDIMLKYKDKKWYQF